jgi:ferritin-like metal-binding protein YciE
MQGLTSEMDEDLEDFGKTEAADDVLIGCAQAIEHYEIARYGLLKTWAGKLGLTEAERLLGETLAEEKNADALLTQVAAGRRTNADAAHGEAKAGKAKAA